MSENKTRLVGTVKKNTGEEIRINLVKWKEEYFDIRLWFKGDDGEFHPSTKGLRLSCELLPDLITALGKAQAEVEGGVEIVQDGPEVDG
jgi:hypothetical protein